MPLSAKQMEYLALAIDYAKFATVAGLASANSARELMRVTKNKLRDEYGSLSSGLQNSNATVAGPKTPSKRGRATMSASATPTSRKRTKKEKEKTVEVEAGGDGREKVADGGKENGGKSNGVVAVKNEQVSVQEESDEEASFF
ncbi:hypothetical protein Q7P37_007266 [Cladosporium fusiforme]